MCFLNLSEEKKGGDILSPVLQEYRKYNKLESPFLKKIIFPFKDCFVFFFLNSATYALSFFRSKIITYHLNTLKAMSSSLIMFDICD